MGISPGLVWSGQSSWRKLCLSWDLWDELQTLKPGKRIRSSRNRICKSLQRDRRKVLEKIRVLSMVRLGGGKREGGGW